MLLGRLLSITTIIHSLTILSSIPVYRYIETLEICQCGYNIIMIYMCWYISCMKSHTNSYTHKTAYKVNFTCDRVL